MFLDDAPRFPMIFPLKSEEFSFIRCLSFRGLMCRFFQHLRQKRINRDFSTEKFTFGSIQPQGTIIPTPWPWKISQSCSLTFPDERWWKWVRKWKKHVLLHPPSQVFKEMKHHADDFALVSANCPIHCTSSSRECELYRNAISSELAMPALWNSSSKWRSLQIRQAQKNYKSVYIYIYTYIHTYIYIHIMYIYI